jgi:hypothetical protein
MSKHLENLPAKLVVHYRELADGEVQRAKFALTNEARADHYARAAEHLRLAKAAEEFAGERSRPCYSGATGRRL